VAELQARGNELHLSGVKDRLADRALDFQRALSTPAFVEVDSRIVTQSVVQLDQVILELVKILPKRNIWGWREFDQALCVPRSISVLEDLDIDDVAMFSEGVVKVIGGCFWGDVKDSDGDIRPVGIGSCWSDVGLWNSRSHHVAVDALAVSSAEGALDLVMVKTTTIRSVDRRSGVSP